MILKIRQKLEISHSEDVPTTQAVRVRLGERLNDITHTLPDDLKTILKQES